jgi:ABC-type spermidine/putrescine transport system permease subunit II
LSRAQGRRFGFTLAPAFLALAALLFWRDRDTIAIIAASLGVLLGLAAILIPGRLGPVERAWMSFALALSRVTSPIILGIVWYLVLTPMGVLRRAIGGNPLSHREVAGGFWVRRTDSRRSDLRRQF